MSDNPVQSNGFSNAPLQKQPGVLKIYKTGELTVVGFGGTDVPDEVCVAEYREELLKLIEEQRCKVLAFDLDGVKLIPSGMLGLLISLKKRGLEIELYNPSPDILEVLEVTRLGDQFVIRGIEP